MTAYPDGRYAAGTGERVGECEPENAACAVDARTSCEARRPVRLIERRITCKSGHVSSDTRGEYQEHFRNKLNNELDIFENRNNFS